MNEPYCHHQHEEEEEEDEKEEDEMVLSTAQLDCRLLPGELVIAHVKRE